jgi:hypothetical protein
MAEGFEIETELTIRSLQERFKIIEVPIEYRNRIIRVDNKQVLVAKLSGSLQEQDLAKPPNCNGLGR